MTIRDFSREIDSVIVERGKEYFRGGLVENLEEDPEGFWTADVEGTYTYSVSVEMSRNSITDWECDCPYEHGPVCKHVAAVLYAIAKAKGGSVEEKQKAQKDSQDKKNNVDTILGKLSKDDIVHFLIARFKADKSLKHLFLAQFADLTDEAIDKKYHTLIQNIRNSARGRDGYIDYHAAGKMTKLLQDLVEKAGTLRRQDNVVESLAICKAIVEEAPAIVDIIDESDGDMYTVLETALEELGMLAAKAPPLLRDDLFGYLLDAYRTEGYRRIGIDSEILRIASSLAVDAGHEQQLFRLIDEQIAISARGNGMSYNIPTLVEAKIDYLENRKRHDEARALLEEYRHHRYFRERLIREAIEKRQYDVARTLCIEGIEEAKKDYAPGYLHQWRSLLLEIALLQKKPADIRSLAEDLFFNGHGSIEYYRHIRSTYSKKEWPAAYRELVDRIQNGRHSFNKERILADVYIEEKKLNDLMQLIQSNAGLIEFVDTYAKHVYKTYPAKLLACYEQGLAVYVQQIGRTYYEQAVVYLKKMQELPGGTGRVHSLVMQLREQYRQRRAMKEILDKAFPDIG